MMKNSLELTVTELCCCNEGGVMKPLKTCLYAVLAGACISLGGTAFLSLDNKVLGAFFFVIGLFTICTFGFNLFTGKVCYSIGAGPSYIVTLVIIWIGNLLGCLIIALIESLTRIGPALTERAVTMANTKLADNGLSLFILAFFCNVCIYIAVDGFKNNPHELGKYLSLVFGVMVFILCGFEHSVADMYYFSIAHAWSAKTLLYVIIITLGNAVGGLIIPVFKLVAEKNG